MYVLLTRILMYAHLLLNRRTSFVMAQDEVGQEIELGDDNEDEEEKYNSLPEGRKNAIKAIDKNVVHRICSGQVKNYFV